MTRRANEPTTVPCVMCRFPEDVAKMRSNIACCTGCSDTCVCLARDYPSKGCVAHEH